MTTEIFTGTPAELQLRIAAIIGGTGVIHSVTLTSNRGIYLILWT